jgi:N-carbamoyl-L-amino-acid hydrolase
MGARSRMPDRAVGRLEVRPNSRAVVPGAVTLVIDIRDRDAARIDEIDGAIRADVRAIAAADGVDVELEVALEIPVTICDAILHAVVERAGVAAS